jgi:serine/threonine protein kinase
MTDPPSQDRGRRPSVTSYFGCLTSVPRVSRFADIAPEVLNRMYDKSCDLWSLGVIM